MGGLLHGVRKKQVFEAKFCCLKFIAIKIMPKALFLLKLSRKETEMDLQLLYPAKLINFSFHCVKFEEHP